MPNAPEACDLLIDGGLVLTLDGADRIIADGAVAITADRIVAVETAASALGTLRPARGSTRGGASSCQGW